MLRLTIANALAHRSRLALTWLAVALGVAFVTGSLVLTDSSSAVLDDQFRTTASGVDISVRTAAAFDSAMGVEVQRAPLRPDVVQSVTAVSGVAQARGTASGTAQLQVRGNAASTSGSTRLETWVDAPFSAYRLRAGRPPQGTDEAVLDQATALRESVAVGDTVTVAAGASRALRVVGLAGVGDSDGPPSGSLVLVSLPAAQALLDLGSGLSSVDVITQPGVNVATVRARLATTLGREYAVTSGQDIVAASAQGAQQSVDLLRLVLLVLAGAGFVVGAFLIANTFTIVIAQRGRELALLRASGATGGQVFGSVVGEAFLVGAFGAVAGTAAGVGAAAVLRMLAEAAGVDLPDGPLTVSARTLVMSFILGTSVTVLAALGPARRAARTAPVEAMRFSDPTRATAGRARRLTGAILCLAGALLLASGATTGLLAVVGLGALLFLTALVALGPTLAPRVAGFIGRPLNRLGVPGQLARETSLRNPRRTAGTVMALALGLALISFVTVLEGSVKAAVAASYQDVITADLVVESSGNEMLGGLSPEVARRAAELPAVTGLSTIRFGHWLDDGVAHGLTAVDPSTLPDVAQLRMIAGSLTALDRGGVVLGAQEAASRGLKVGDHLTMTFPRGGSERVPVVGLMDDASVGALGTNEVISLASYAARYNENVDASVLVAVADDADPAEVRTALVRAVGDYPNAQVRDLAEAAAGRTAALSQVLGMITVLLGFSVLIALLGITNTLALSIVERTRELGLLRAVGMTERQVRAMVRSEAVLVAGIAVVVGVGAGLVLAAATLTGLGSTLPLVVRVPAIQLAVVVVGAVLAGLVAGLLPARRAARIEVLRAIAVQ